MSCCKNIPIDGEYVPINKRLLEYGKEVYGEATLKEFPHTHLWIFTFYNEEDMCIECQEKFSNMLNWLTKYNLLNDPIKNTKWIIDDDIKNNLVFIDLELKKSPVHLFCDTNGKIIDIVYGFPSVSWLEKYILPLIRREMA